MTSEIKKLINDDLFILWCLSPNEELDLHWKKWLKEHPGEEASLNQAKDIVKSVRLNSYSLPNAQSEVLSNRLKESFAKKNKLSHLRKTIYLSACAILLFCLIGTWIWNSPSSESNIPALLAQSDIDEKLTQIELILNNQRKMLLENRTAIDFNRNGAVNVDKKQLSIAHEKNLISTSLNILRVPKGKKISLKLGDGTKIWVNSGSIVLFPSVFGANNRTIYVDGEVFLNVHRDIKRPFFVKTASMDVRVLGTSFDVKSYRKDASHQVVLCEGRVEVINRSGKKFQILPKEMLTLKGQVETKTQVNTDNYTFWVDETLVIQNKSLGQVLNLLSQYYEIKINCSPNIQNLICSGKLILFDDIQSVLKTLSVGLPIHCHHEKNAIEIVSSEKQEPATK